MAAQFQVRDVILVWLLVLLSPLDRHSMERRTVTAHHSNKASR